MAFLAPLGEYSAKSTHTSTANAIHILAESLIIRIKQRGQKPERLPHVYSHACLSSRSFRPRTQYIFWAKGEGEISRNLRILPIIAHVPDVRRDRRVLMGKTSEKIEKQSPVQFSPSAFLTPKSIAYNSNPLHMFPF